MTRGRTAKVAGQVIVLSEIFHPVTTSTGYYISEIASLYATLHGVRVLCAQPFATQCPRWESWRGLDIVRIGRMRGFDSGIIIRAAGAACWVGRILWWLIWRCRRNDVLFVVTNPPFLPSVAALVSRIRRAHLIILAHDVYPHAAVVAGVIRKGGLVERAALFIQRWTLRRASRVICLGRDMERLIHAVEPSTGEKTLIIRNWAEMPPAVMPSKSTSVFAARAGTVSAFTVLHAGNLGRTHDAEVAVQAAKLLCQVNNIVLLFATAGPISEVVEKAINSGTVQNIRVSSMTANREGQWDTLAAADVVLVVFKSGMAGVSVPSRLYNAMAAGKPLIVVADDESEIACVVTEERIGWVVTPGRADQLRDAILAAWRDPVQLREMGRRAETAARDSYSMQQSLKKYAALLRTVSTEGSGS